MNVPITVDTKKHWGGRRFICLARQSNDDQGNDSVRAQLEFLKAACEKLRMIFVAEVVLEGVSGSVPGKRSDIDELIERKRIKDDYDVLVVQRYDRLTRGGASHGFWAQHEFEKVGVELFFPGEDVPDGPWASLIQSAKYEGAREFARSLSQRSTQGRGQALMEGRHAPFSHTPLGCWRLFSSPDGEPKFYIRNLAGPRKGLQEKVALDRTTVIDTYGEVGGGAKGHYRKQKNELVTLAPGDPAEQNTVRGIMIDRWRDNRGGGFIADKLNRQGVLSPLGKHWSKRSVEVVYENTAYAGLGICNLSSTAIFNEVGHGSTPKVAEVSASTLAKGKPPRRLRPPEDWVQVELPLMKGFLPPEVEAKLLMVMPKQLKLRYERSIMKTTKKRSNSRHKNSEYLLSGKIESKQDGEKLVGSKVGKKNYEQRRYRNKAARRKYLKGSVLNKTIGAEVVEQAVLKQIVEALQDSELVRATVQQLAVQPEIDFDVETRIADLEDERSEKTVKIQHAFKTMRASALAAIQEDLDLWSERIEQIDAELKTLGQQDQNKPIDPGELAGAILNHFKNLHLKINEAARPRLRQLIDAFVEKVVVDQETMQFEVFLRLPADLAGCLVNMSQSLTDHQTPPPRENNSTSRGHLRLAEADCQSTKAHQCAPVVCDCHRRPRRNAA